jgi:DnaK suppressor protein
MASKKPAKAKKPAAKKAEGKKPARGQPVAAKPKAAAPKATKARPSASGARVAKVPPAKIPPAKAPPAKPAGKPVATKPAVAPKKPALPAGAGASVVRAAPPLAPLRRPVPSFPAPRVVTTSRGATTAVDLEDEDGSLSLLAGPRNVKPYLAKKGEQYMGKAQLEHFRTILLSWKRDLMEEVDRTVTHMKDEAANPPDPNDRATLESEFSLELRTRDRERKLIRKIDEALGRIEDGSYGYCLETGEEIGIKRLEARPVATLSIEAQERRERREKQYGDRDDRYR